MSFYQGTAEKLGLVLVHHAEGGGGYEWSEFLVMVDPTPGGRWYWVAGSGCSCGSLLYEYDGRREWFAVGARADALRAAESWDGWAEDGRFDEIRQRLTQAIRDWIPS